MATVLDELLAAVKTAEYPADANAVSDGLRALLRLAGPDAVNLSPAFTDYLISLIDEKVSAQVNLILHHPDFVALEAT